MFLLYQIIVSQWGLSLGEIETINNLFKDYDILENPINQNVGYASTLEIEFLKNKDTDFFDCHNNRKMDRSRRSYQEY